MAWLGRRIACLREWRQGISGNVYGWGCGGRRPRCWWRWSRRLWGLNSSAWRLCTSWRWGNVCEGWGKRGLWPLFLPLCRKSWGRWRGEMGNTSVGVPLRWFPLPATWRCDGSTFPCRLRVVAATALGVCWPISRLGPCGWPAGPLGTRRTNAGERRANAEVEGSHFWECPPPSGLTPSRALWGEGSRPGGTSVGGLILRGVASGSFPAIRGIEGSFLRLGLAGSPEAWGGTPVGFLSPASGDVWAAATSPVGGKPGPASVERLAGRTGLGAKAAAVDVDVEHRRGGRCVSGTFLRLCDGLRVEEGRAE